MRAFRENGRGVRKALKGWRRTCEQYLRPHIALPSQLRLNFTCDVGDVETGTKAVQPLLSGTPQTLLAGCSIRLCRKPDPELSALAETTVNLLIRGGRALKMSANGAQVSFRFMDLPTELRLCILEFTNLVLPSDEVEWNAVHGYYHKLRMTDRHERRFPTINKSMYHSRDMPYAEAEKISCWRKEPRLIGCFCKVHHAAYSSIQLCQCWSPPTPIVLVSRSMQDDGLSIFFRQNRFVIVPDGGKTWKVVDKNPARLPVSVFSRQIPEDCQHYLRSLELVFPVFGKQTPFQYCPPQSAACHDWNQTLDWAKENLNLQNLIINAYFAPSHQLMMGQTDFSRNFRQEGMSAAQYQIIKNSHISTLAPLKKLRGLDKFFVYLGDFARWLREGNDPKSAAEFEHEIEQSVMGGEYDAVAAGKKFQRAGFWCQLNLGIRRYNF
ncbi:hypothetical protein K431DRAFT_348638 [Polychaeton citri CBS 116435]|uniref:Uncharacterized protein n=1 Tax=Polychaeton citri CBS 116435 TaxID=1314669 RepID=A0A9P4Q4Y2_9PEZI|nr:hypothetical protein K431DRAFT_348638 [Polychaeton citri CBS 116435]